MPLFDGPVPTINLFFLQDRKEFWNCHHSTELNKIPVYLYASYA